MLEILKARLQQGYRTTRYPAGPAPDLPPRFAGRPAIDSGKCRQGCDRCAQVCPTRAIQFDLAARKLRLTAGCLFCREGERACEPGAITFTREHRLASSTRQRSSSPIAARRRRDRRLAPAAARSRLRLRQVSRRRLQCLRSRHERPRHGRLGPGPLRHPVRGFPAARRRVVDHRAGHREHARP